MKPKAPWIPRPAGVGIAAPPSFSRGEKPHFTGSRKVASPPVFAPASERPASRLGMRDLRVLLLIVVGWSAAAVLHMTSGYAVYRLGGPSEPLRILLGEPVLRCAVLVLETWAIFAITDRYPVQRAGAVRNAFIQLGFAIPLVFARILVYHGAGQALGLLSPGVGPLMAVAQLYSRGVVGYLLLVGLAHAVKYAQTARERELAQSQLETQLAQGQLHVLKMQLHPHFLFNTLHAISALVHSKPDQAEQMIANLSEMLRATLARRDAQEVTLREELSLLEPYLDIEKIRFGDRLSVTLQVADEAMDAVVPHLLLQPLVENAIRHGIAPQRAGGRIAIRAHVRDGSLEVEVEDDGVGMPADPRPDGVGLGNTRARLHRLYGERHAFRIDSSPGTPTRVTVMMPLRMDAPGVLI